MFQMPLLSVVLYIATCLKLDGQVVDESMVSLFHAYPVNTTNAI